MSYTLKRLDLNDNSLTSIPSSIARLRKLQLLQLDRNRIEELPEAIDQATAQSLVGAHFFNRAADVWLRCAGGVRVALRAASLSPLP